MTEEMDIYIVYNITVFVAFIYSKSSQSESYTHEILNIKECIKISNLAI